MLKTASPLSSGAVGGRMLGAVQCTRFVSPVLHLPTCRPVRTRIYIHVELRDFCCCGVGECTVREKKREWQNMLLARLGRLAWPHCSVWIIENTGSSFIMAMVPRACSTSRMHVTQFAVKCEMHPKCPPTDTSTERQHSTGMPTSLPMRANIPHRTHHQMQ